MVGRLLGGSSKLVSKVYRRAGRYKEGSRASEELGGVEVAEGLKSAVVRPRDS